MLKKINHSLFRRESVAEIEAGALEDAQINLAKHMLELEQLETTIQKYKRRIARLTAAQVAA